MMLSQEGFRNNLGVPAVQERPHEIRVPSSRGRLEGAEAAKRRTAEIGRASCRERV